MPFGHPAPGLVLPLYLQAESPHKPNTIEVQPFSYYSEASSTEKANMIWLSLIKYMHSRPRDLLEYQIVQKKNPQWEGIGWRGHGLPH